MKRALALLLCAGPFACGGPRAGASCKTNGYACQDNANALECRSGTWVVLPCYGDGGCTVAASQVSCDMSGDNAGDLCATSAEGKGMCSASGKATLECRSGVLAQTGTCSSCTVDSGGQLVCSP